MPGAFCCLKLTLLVFVLAVNAGCTHGAMDYTVASWQKRQVSEVITAWGNPSEELKVDGKHLLLWNTYDGRLSAPSQKRPALHADTLFCIRLLKVDSVGEIVDGTWDGNDCPGWFSGWYR